MESGVRSWWKAILAFLQRPEVRRLYGVDVRALAAMRIGLGILLLLNYFERLPYLTAHYGDAGAMPLAAVEGFSLHALHGSPVFEGLMFAIAALFAVLLILGYRTWVATAVSWVLLVSLHQRNMLINNSGDHLIVLLLFWGLFLPLGARASVDARAARTRVPQLIASPASLAILVQMIWVYVFSAILKSHPIWREEGTAIYYALQLDRYTTAFGRWLAEVPVLHEPLTHATWWLELVGPFFAFIPVGFLFFRHFTAFAFIGFHLGLVLSFDLIWFPYVCIIGWLAYLPSEFWDRLLGLAPMRWLARSWGRLTEKTHGAIDALARKQPRLPVWSLDYKPLPLRDVLVGTAMIYVFFVNLGTVAPRMEMPGWLSWIGRDLNIQQKWAMFSPYPSRHDGWWVMPATLKDGSEVDLFTGSEGVTWDKPFPAGDVFSTKRWRKYLENVWEQEHREHVTYYAAWLRHDWNRRHDASRQVESMEIYFMLEYTQPAPDPPRESKKRVYGWSVAGDEQIEGGPPKAPGVR